MHFTPVHCSWMNQVEQWFSILQRKRMTAPNFADLDALEERVLAFIDKWNAHAHPFRWTVSSAIRVARPSWRPMRRLEWAKAVDVADVARTVLVGIDCNPASCAFASQTVGERAL